MSPEEIVRNEAVAVVRINSDNNFILILENEKFFLTTSVLTQKKMKNIYTISPTFILCIQ